MAPEELRSGPRLDELVEHARLEVMPLGGAEEDVAGLPPGVMITVTCSPKHGVDHTLDVAERLAAHGRRVVPHIAARMVSGRDHLCRLVMRMAAADIREAFVIGGDAAPCVGAYAGAGALLDDLAGIEHGLTDIGVGAYPEGHPTIDDAALWDALADKQRIATYMTTQLCFDPHALGGWLREARRRSIELPAVIGVAGAVQRRRLLEISMRVGVGTSLRYLRKQRGLVSQLRGGYDPSQLLADGADLLQAPESRVAELHVFTFNQIAATQRWRERLLGELRAGDALPSQTRLVP